MKQDCEVAKYHKVKEIKISKILYYVLKKNPVLLHGSDNDAGVLVHGAEE